MRASQHRRSPARAAFGFRSPRSRFRRSGVAGASAQDTPPPPETNGENASDGETIIVTGSRLARTTFDTPSPVTVLGGADFERLQITNVGEGVAELPAFRPSEQPGHQRLRQLQRRRADRQLCAASA